MSGAWAGRSCRSSLLEEGPIPRLRRGLPHEWGRWRDRHDLTVLALKQLPSGHMHHPMVPVTEQHEVVERGRPAVDPVQMSVMLRGPDGLAPQCTSRGGFHLNRRPPGKKKAGRRDFIGAW